MLRRGIEPLRAGREHAAHELVGEFRGRDVEDAGYHPAGDERFHRPAAGARGVEHEDFVARLLQKRHRRLDALRGVSEHAGHDERFVVAVRHVGLHHATDRTRRPGKDRARDSIQPLHVYDRWHHRDVGRAEVWRRVAAGERGDHQFRKADRQRPHRGRGDRRAAAAAEGDHALDPAFGSQLLQQPRRRLRHCRHALAAVAAGHERREIDAPGRCHGAARNVGLDCRLSPCAHVDQERGVAPRMDPLRHERMFAAFRVERAEDGDHRHAVTSSRVTSSGRAGCS